MKIPSTYISKVSLFAVSMSYDNYGKRAHPTSKRVLQGMVEALAADVVRNWD